MVLQEGHSQPEPHLQIVEPWEPQHSWVLVLAAVGLATIGAGADFLEQQDIEDMLKKLFDSRDLRSLYSLFFFFAAVTDSRT